MSLASETFAFAWESRAAILGEVVTYAGNPTTVIWTAGNDLDQEILDEWIRVEDQAVIEVSLTDIPYPEIGDDVIRLDSKGVRTIWQVAGRGSSRSAFGGNDGATQELRLVHESFKERTAARTRVNRRYAG